MEILEERIRSFRAEMAAGQTSFSEFKACGASEFFGARDPIVSRR